MKISPVLPIALSTLLTASLAVPLALRYPSPVEAEKRADTFLTPKGRPDLFDAVHSNLNLRSEETLLVKKDVAPTVETKRALGALDSGNGSPSTSSFSSAIHDDLNFGGSTDSTLGSSSASLSLFKRAVNAVKRAGGALTSGHANPTTHSFSSAIHDDLNFGGTTDPLLAGGSLALFKKAVGNAAENVATPFNA